MKFVETEKGLKCLLSPGDIAFFDKFFSYKDEPTLIQPVPKPSRNEVLLRDYQRDLVDSIANLFTVPNLLNCSRVDSKSLFTCAFDPAAGPDRTVLSVFQQKEKRQLIQQYETYKDVPVYGVPGIHDGALLKIYSDNEVGVWSSDLCEGWNIEAHLDRAKNFFRDTDEPPHIARFLVSERTLERYRRERKEAEAKRKAEEEKRKAETAEHDAQVKRERKAEAEAKVAAAQKLIREAEASLTCHLSVSSDRVDRVMW